MTPFEVKDCALFCRHIRECLTLMRVTLRDIKANFVNV